MLLIWAHGLRVATHKRVYCFVYFAANMACSLRVSAPKRVYCFVYFAANN